MLTPEEILIAMSRIPVAVSLQVLASMEACRPYEATRIMIPHVGARRAREITASLSRRNAT